MDNKLRFNPTGSGIGIGKAIIHNYFSPAIEKVNIPKHMVNDEIKRYRSAKSNAIAEINHLAEILGAKDLDKARILKVQIEMINDSLMDQTIIKTITENYVTCSYAVYEAYELFIKILESSDNVISKSRVSDFLDVRNRLLRNYEGIKENSMQEINEDSIIIAEELFPSELVLINKKYLKGIITLEGSPNSHVAILAKSYDIPAFIGINQQLTDINQGETIVLDATNGYIHINPDDNELRKYECLLKEYKQKQDEINSYLEKDAVTKDNVRINLYVNINSSSAEELKVEKYVDGVGLYRSEYNFFSRNSPPSVDEQYQSYKKVLIEFGRKEVTIRTIDIGADKVVSYLDIEAEENPALGNRGIRLCFSHMKIFKNQLKALLKSSVCGKLNIMIPFVSTIDEIIKVKEIINEVKKELKKENIPYGEYKLGIMIETPSIAYISDLVCKEVDFASIGTNDLTQYMLSCDRFDEKMNQYYQKMNPSVLRLVYNVIKSFNNNNTKISLCGELAGDTLAIPLLLAMGLRDLSVSGSSVAKVKKTIINTDISRIEKNLNSILNSETEEELKDKLTKLGG